MTVPVDTWTDKVMRFKVQEDRYDADSNYCKSLLLSLGYGNGSGINYIKELWISDLILYEITEDEYNATSYTPVGYNDIDNYVSGNNSISIKNKNFFEIETPDYIAHYAWDGYGNGTYTQLDNGYEFTDRFRAIAFEFDNLTVGEKYTLSFNVVATSNVTCGVGQNKNRGNTETSSSKNYSVTTTTSRQFFTFTATTTNRLAFNSGNVTPNTITITDIQLEKGEQDTSYLVHQENNYPISLARIPSEYQEVEYIESNGTQFLDTNIALWNTTNWKIQFKMFVNEHYNYNAILGFNDVVDTNNEVWIYSNRNYAWRACGVTRTAVMQLPENEDIEIVHDNSGNNFIIIINGEEKINTTKATGTANHSLCFGHRNGGGWFKGKLYYLKLWSEGTLVRDFIPCYRISDNIAGLYDTVNNVFYPNANTGSTAQPFISGEKIGTNIQLSENDKIWNDNGVWKLNDTEIIDTDLLEQLNALNDMQLYNNLSYVDWTGNVEAPMKLKYNIDVVSGDNNVVSQNKNILVASGDTSFMSGITVTKNNASNIIINGSGTGGVGSKAFAINGNGGANYTTYITNVEVKTLKAGTYAFSVHNITGETTATEVNFDVIKMKSSTPHQQIARIRYGQSSSAVFTVTEEGDYYFAVGFAYSNSAVSFTNFSFDVQLEKNTQATSFLAHQGNSYRVDLGGKNLFNKNDVENDKRLDSNGQATSGSASGFSLTNYIKVKPSTTYTYSRELTSSNYYVNISEYTSDKTHIQRLYSAGNTTTKYTFTTPNNCEYLRINDATSNLDNIQLEERKYSNAF